MGQLIDGQWHDGDGTLVDASGSFRRASSQFSLPIPDTVLDQIANTPSRFVLFASRSCPWSHRALLVRAILGLTNIPVQIATGLRHQGYPVNGNVALNVPGITHAITYVHELYSHAMPNYTGRATVPILWDGHEGRILCNQSSLLMQAFDRLAEKMHGEEAPTLFPNELDLAGQAEDFDKRLANGVYRAGLATSQTAYETACNDVFGYLDWVEARLSTCRVFFGDTLSAMDVKLFACLVRFDTVYATHFRCTRRRLTDYPNLWRYVRRLYALPEFSRDVDFDEIRRGYFLNDGNHNPSGIISEAPALDWSMPDDSHLTKGLFWANRRGGTLPYQPMKELQPC